MGCLEIAKTPVVISFEFLTGVGNGDRYLLSWRKAINIKIILKRSRAILRLSIYLGMEN